MAAMYASLSLSLCLTAVSCSSTVMDSVEPALTRWPPVRQSRPVSQGWQSWLKYKYIYMNEYTHTHMHTYIHTSPSGTNARETVGGVHSPACSQPASQPGGGSLWPASHSVCPSRSSVTDHLYREIETLSLY
eukprot:GHVU01223960.1.p1 GENE.GHVU01223960.1~~GHVU01223960.1.p1  ORF type:complete len:132 (-),score=7.24 GHVU01223960.1:73-468(-)